MKASHSSNFLRHYGELALNGRFFLVAANGRLRQGLNSGGGGGGGAERIMERSAGSSSGRCNSYPVPEQIICLGNEWSLGFMVWGESQIEHYRPKPDLHPFKSNAVLAVGNSVHTCICNLDKAGNPDLWY
mmetsp:Transcript_32766/g.53498  ORF Transcript_32766/g.53498 Transcript_32766/m.53498 type:complete len:130 (-) Transcript_32766:1628-2017(-)